MGQALAFLSVVALLTPAANGQAQERFQLFNARRPMVLVIEDLPDGAAAIGLNEQSLQAAAESRLRAARLYTEEWERAGFSSLNVNVNVIAQAWNLSVQYKKWVSDAFGVSNFASTWSDGSTGTHSGDAGYIVSSLSEHLDSFLAAYLRVNEEACSAPAPRP